jgi:RHH-type proline utilization regulon transcriptional repressor/proline dehydrogenase/delta 1-pyrroline-5-carboxylate dehydrogenase
MPAPAADLYEANAPEIFALLAREAGKTPPMPWPSCARRSISCATTPPARRSLPRIRRAGVFACISPWNFPLAIFTGQIAAALAAGNAVLAKPAEATPLIAARATALLHEAGVPRAALQLLPGHGATVGAALCLPPGIDGVASPAPPRRRRRSTAPWPPISPPTPR